MFLKKMDKNKKYSIWIVITILTIIIIFGLFAAVTIYIDPFFHYHAPLKHYEYPIENERYQNDGITNNFEYDSIITGTSMVENFMVTEANDAFHANFIKVAYSGGHYKEIKDNLERAYQAGKKIKYVVRSIDYSMLIDDKDGVRTDVEYPTYLYNDLLFDDLNYVLNKSIFFDYTWNVIKYTREGNKTTCFDDYSNWNDNYTFGIESVLDSYVLNEPAEIIQLLTEEEREMVFGNVRQNVTTVAAEHPETEFYLFFPPYSICYWDQLKNDGGIERHLAAEQIAIEEMIKYPNIKLYSFCNNFDLVCNLENYKDQAHYGEWVNSWILEQMQTNEYLLTAENYLDYIKIIRNFYTNYDYGSLRE